MQTNSVGRDRRTQIIEAAIGQLAKHGDSGATFARIVEAGGLSSPGLISYHFADRGELLESVYLYVAELRRAWHARALAGFLRGRGRGVSRPACLGWPPEAPG